MELPLKLSLLAAIATAAAPAKCMMQKGKNQPPLASTWIDFAVVGICRSVMELPLKLSLLAAIVTAAAPAKCMMDQNLSRTT